MTTKMVLVSAVALGMFMNSACSSPSPEREIANPQRPVAYEPAPIKELSRAELRDELLTLDSEISGLDLLIASARARRAHYKTVGYSDGAPAALGAETEILGYELQKQELKEKKLRLLSDLARQ